MRRILLLAVLALAGCKSPYMPDQCPEICRPCQVHEVNYERCTCNTAVCLVRGADGGWENISGQSSASNVVWYGGR